MNFYTRFARMVAFLVNIVAERSDAKYKISSSFLVAVGASPKGQYKIAAVGRHQNY